MTKKKKKKFEEKSPGAQAGSAKGSVSERTWKKILELLGLEKTLLNRKERSGTSRGITDSFKIGSKWDRQANILPRTLNHFDWEEPCRHL